MNQDKRLLLAIALSMLIIVGWQEWYVKPMLKAQDPGIVTPYIQSKSTSPKTIEQRPRTEVIAEGYKNHHRVRFNNEEIEGSVNLLGARLDDLVLRKYKVTATADSPPLTMFSPSHTPQVYFAEIGWLSPDHDVIVPNHNTLWIANKKEFTVEEPLKLHWTNPQGIRFEIDLTITNDFMFHIVQEVHNPINQQIRLQRYALLNRADNLPHDSSMVVHEGGVGVFNNSLHEIAFSDINKSQPMRTEQGWIGFSDKYWLAAIIPHIPFQGKFSSFQAQGKVRFQADMYTDIEIIEPGATENGAFFFYAGAKRLDLLDFYRNRFNIPLFDRAVDFGMLYFITKPTLTLLHALYNHTGNFGIAILVLTVLIKFLLFPLAYKGYKGMNRLKDLQPKMTELREQHKDDPAAIQKAIIELYKKEKVNPLSGCLPLLLQAPVFFALYKVLYVSIEMRHAPLFAWIHDLSAPDPTTIFNLFGLIPWTPPTMLMIGVFPIFMAFTMYVQQRLNPEPADPTQAQVMRMLPLIFLFMFASFPVGLVVYWSWSNVLSIAQQLLIKKMTTKKRVHTTPKKLK